MSKLMNSSSESSFHWSSSLTSEIGERLAVEAAAGEGRPRPWRVSPSTSMLETSTLSPATSPSPASSSQVAIASSPVVNSVCSVKACVCTSVQFSAASVVRGLLDRRGDVVLVLR